MELQWENLFSLAVRFGTLGLLILVVILFLIYMNQNKILYIPEMSTGGILRSQDSNPEGYRHPGEHDLLYEDVFIKTADNINLHGWFIKQPEPLLQQTATVVYFHENAGNIGTRMDFIKHYTKFKMKVNLLIVAYRGMFDIYYNLFGLSNSYSKSEGVPSEEGLQLDSKAVLNYIFNERNDIDKKTIFVHGRSLGGAVSIYAVTNTDFKIAGLIIENTFTSISDMADTIFPKLSFFKKLIQRNFWPSIERIANIKLPILFIIAMKDEIVPANQMVRLEMKATSAVFKEKHIIPNGLHNSSWTDSPDNYFRSINDFMMKAFTFRQN